MISTANFIRLTPLVLLVINNTVQLKSLYSINLPDTNHEHYHYIHELVQYNFVLYSTNI